AQEQAEAARPYAERLERVLRSLAANMAEQQGAPALLTGTGSDAVHLIVVMTSDRGLCGGFNSTIVRGARRLIPERRSDGKQVKVLCVGRRGRDQLRRDFGEIIIGTIEEIAKPRLTFEAADRVARRISGMFEAGEFDVCTIIYNRFKSAMTQIVTTLQLIPFTAEEATQETVGSGAIYEYEPDEAVILSELLPHNLSVQIYKALLENGASEEGARMTAMDSATRNAGEMINRLTINYNRSRQ